MVFLMIFTKKTLPYLDVCSRDKFLQMDDPLLAEKRKTRKERGIRVVSCVWLLGLLGGPPHLVTLRIQIPPDRRGLRVPIPSLA